MKILYAALRHDPRNPDLASGVDYNFYSAFIREGAEVKVVGPFKHSGWLIERALRNFYKTALKRRYLKWSLQITRFSARALNEAEKAWHPDVVFSIFPPPLAFYDGETPCVFNTDTTFQGWQEGGAGFGGVPLRILAWLERRAICRSSRTITFSEWCKKEIVARHHVSPGKIVVMPMPSALPATVVPSADQFAVKRMGTPIRLLLIGRDYKRKGIPIAIEVAKLLNQRGISAELTIGGLDGQPDGPVRFAGLFRKAIPAELEQYANLYRQNDLLLHPATFDPSPIVPAEAAAFGLPTISNDVGGIGTSVAHGVSGIVLPRHSPAEAYVETVIRLAQNPSEYAKLSAGARNRYELEQNWQVTGRKVMRILEETATAGRN